MTFQLKNHYAQKMHYSELTVKLVRTNGQSYNVKNLFLSKLECCRHFNRLSMPLIVTKLAQLNKNNNIQKSKLLTYYNC